MQKYNEEQRFEQSLREQTEKIENIKPNYKTSHAQVLTKEDYELSDKMTTYLTNFVKTGNPNSEGLNTWDVQTKKQKKVMHFGNGVTEMQKTKTDKLWVNMFTKKAVGE